MKGEYIKSNLLGALSIIAGVFALFSLAILLLAFVDALGHGVGGGYPDKGLQNSWPFFGISLVLSIPVGIVLGIISKRKEKGMFGTIGLGLCSFASLIILMIVGFVLYLYLFTFR